jgi:hypothetical protein
MIPGLGRWQWSVCLIVIFFLHILPASEVEFARLYLWLAWSVIIIIFFYSPVCKAADHRIYLTHIPLIVPKKRKITIIMFKLNVYSVFLKEKKENPKLETENDKSY